MAVPVSVLLVLAGCTAPQNEGDSTRPTGLDTGTIPPGQEKSLEFAQAGSYKLHCDPHPFMKHNVTAQAGGPPTAHVHILDGNTTADHRFNPQHVTIAPRAVVTYHNHGSLDHTATETTAEHGGH